MLSDVISLRTDFFTVIKVTKDNYDDEAYMRFKSMEKLDFIALTKWIFKVRRRVSGRIKRAKHILARTKRR